MTATAAPSRPPSRATTLPVFFPKRTRPMRSTLLSAARPLRLAAALFLAAACAQAPLHAQTAAPAVPQPVPGPVFTDFGATYRVKQALPIPPSTVFKVAFNTTEGAKPGEINRAVGSIGRFINMLVAAGVPEKNIHTALVVHGTAGPDLTTDAAYRATHNGVGNASAGPIRELLDHGVAIYLCGQSMIGRGTDPATLIPGVQVALSAMAMHAQLQQQGYTLNP